MKVGALEPNPLVEKKRLEPAVCNSLRICAIASLLLDVDEEILHARSARRASRLVMAAELGRVSIRIAV